MSVIFVGDIGVPFGCNIDFSDILPIFRDNYGVANLEGSILLKPSETSERRWTDKYSLYNSPEIISALKQLDIRTLALLNNHTRDFRIELGRTQKYLEENDIQTVGKDNFDTCRFHHNGLDFFIINFTLFGCAHNFRLLNRSHLIAHVKELRRGYPRAHIVAFPHWGLELKRLPEPADRHLAHALIDAGADLIVGHHPHVTQPIETYKGKTIVYSVGNFMMPNAQVGDMKFKPNPDTHSLWAVEYDGYNVKFHDLHFNPDTCKFTYNGVTKPQQIDANENSGSYLTRYIRNTGITHFLRFARYTDTNIGERLRFLRMRAYMLLRRLLIRMHIHNPY